VNITGHVMLSFAITIGVSFVWHLTAYILLHTSYCLCTKDGHFIISSVVKLLTGMNVVVLSRVAANKLSTVEQTPVIIDILCMLHHFVVPECKTKFSPLPRITKLDKEKNQCIREKLEHRT
jgi:hypothetical protein